MALQFDQVAALTQEIIRESSSDNILGSNPLLIHMLDNGKVVLDGGEYIKLPIRYAKITAAGTYTGYSLLDTNPNDTETAVRADWKHYYSNVIISQTELLKNAGKSQMVSLLKAKVDNAMDTLKDNLGTDLFSTNGDSAEGIIGLRALVEATGTIGEIAQSDFSNWASQEDNATSALTLTAMNNLFVNCTIGDSVPDIVCTTKGVWSKYWGLLQANQRFGEAKVARGGFRYLIFNDVPVFHDSHCPGSGVSTANNHMFMLNSKALYFFVHKDNNMLSTKIGPIAQQAVVHQRLSMSCELATDNRRLHGKFTVLKH